MQTVALTLLICFNGLVQNPPPGGDTPLSSERLMRAVRVQAINGSHTWVFTDKQFTLTPVDKKEIPPDLRKALLGDDRVVKKITGQWKLLDDGKLVLSQILADDQAGKKQAELPISPAGHVRVNIHKEQYNLFWK